ncbi:MAG: HAMP domain-containing histidine kinase [Actinobacteria bacterium]|nr:HAMP domain-containing histidine kinase [Actinomycetota bacterium]MBU1494432.1 HAMP domain-containing histidine kinase [Actinomycetota bacterium]MBU1865410.1 HAMP domain-containing histidine kinase [Actinomycetota bacterium]
MRRRAFWGIVGVVLVTMTAAGAAAAVLINRSVQSSVREEFERQAVATARLVEAGARNPGMPGSRRPELGSLLAISAAVGGHDYVEAALVDPGGGVTMAGTESALLDQAPIDLTAITRMIRFEAEVEGGSVAAFLIPVVVGNSRVIVAIGTNLEIVPWNDVLLRFAWAVVLGVALAALLAWWLARSLTRRLDPLREASLAMAAGDMGARVEVGRDDEVAEVEVAFNAMAAGIGESRRREREFLVSVSHDLRTPLTTISGYTEALDEGKVASGDTVRIAGVIHRESSRLGRLVEDFMLLSRIEAREFSLRPESVDLAGHLSGVVEAFRGKADEAGIELVTDLDEMPAVLVDPDRIAQVVGNLLENALRYTPGGGTVRLGLADRGGFAAISVADTGPGIDAADVPHLFERLYVTQRYRPVRPEGSGLGLSIVKELVDAMAGTMEVDSLPGRGTTLTVSIPKAPPPEPPGP